LIETTIVVMVISLLLLVSIPQFLEAQHRVKVTGILQQMENVRLAFNSYHLEHHVYPHTNRRHHFKIHYYKLTTPVTYLQNYQDCLKPYAPQEFIGFEDLKLFPKITANFSCYGKNVISPRYLLTSKGFFPEKDNSWSLKASMPEYSTFQNLYSPTNGLISKGYFLATEDGVLVDGLLSIYYP
jgi:type II secretory pathway pseudopilin PulG